MKQAKNIQQELFAYIKDNTYKDTSNLTSDTLLFAEGIFDSIGFVLLLEFLEEKFNIKADDEDLIEKNFESIDALTAFVQKKTIPVAQ
jgi:acyl carrier protein